MGTRETIGINRIGVGNPRTRACIETSIARTGRSQRFPNVLRVGNGRILYTVQCKLGEATQLKDSLIAAGVYDQIDVYYIADEPALHRNVYRDQDFLDQYVDEFHNVFQGKKSAITFAENKDPENLYPGTGPHYNPPE